MESQSNDNPINNQNLYLAPCQRPENRQSPKDKTEYEKKLRRRVEDRIRKDQEALYLVARVLNIQ